MPSADTCLVFFIVFILVSACLVIDYLSAMPEPSQLKEDIHVENVTQDVIMDHK